jgi:hypothetical protein
LEACRVDARVSPHPPLPSRRRTATAVCLAGSGARRGPEHAREGQLRGPSSGPRLHCLGACRNPNPIVLHTRARRAQLLFFGCRRAAAEFHFRQQWPTLTLLRPRRRARRAQPALLRLPALGGRLLLRRAVAGAGGGGRARARRHDKRLLARPGRQGVRRGAHPRARRARLGAAAAGAAAAPPPRVPGRAAVWVGSRAARGRPCGRVTLLRPLRRGACFRG